VFCIAISRTKYCAMLKQFRKEASFAHLLVDDCLLRLQAVDQTRWLRAICGGGDSGDSWPLLRRIVEVVALLRLASSNAVLRRAKKVVARCISNEGLAMYCSNFRTETSKTSVCTRLARSPHLQLIIVFDRPNDRTGLAR